METFENICCIVVIFMVLLLAVLGALCLLWHLTVDCYCKYKLYKRSNKIQWRCIETTDSINERIAKRRPDFECCLEYRILPSEVNKFVRMYGNNEWKPGFPHKFLFIDKEHFKTFVSNYQTYGQIKGYTERENGILWYEPEE